MIEAFLSLLFQYSIYVGTPTIAETTLECKGCEFVLNQCTTEKVAPVVTRLPLEFDV
jgi:hypothetical protein